MICLFARVIFMSCYDCTLSCEGLVCSVPSELIVLAFSFFFSSESCMLSYYKTQNSILIPNPSLNFIKFNSFLVSKIIHTYINRKPMALIANNN